MGLLLLLALGAAIFYLSASAGTLWFLTHPPRRTAAWAIAKSLPSDPSQLATPRAFQAWTLRRRGLDLHAWDIVGDRPDGPTIVLTHGWGDSRFGALSRVPLACSLASRVIAWDLAGHGDSSGVCTLGTRDVDDLLALLEQVCTPERRDVVLWGWSLGAGVSIALAAKLLESNAGPLVRAIIAESVYRLPITPAANVLDARALPWRVNLRLALAVFGVALGVGPRWRGFDRATHAARLAGRTPILLLHGSADIVSPIADAKDIATAAGARLATITGAGHNDLWTDANFSAHATTSVRDFLSPLA